MPLPFAPRRRKPRRPRIGATRMCRRSDNARSTARSRGLVRLARVSRKFDRSLLRSTGDVPARGRSPGQRLHKKRKQWRAALRNVDDSGVRHAAQASALCSSERATAEVAQAQAGALILRRLLDCGGSDNARESRGQGTAQSSEARKRRWRKSSNCASAMRSSRSWPNMWTAGSRRPRNAMQVSS